MTEASGQTVATFPVRAVILDFGEVLCHRPDPQILAKMADVFAIPPESFLPKYIASRNPYDQGLVTAKEYWQQFGANAGVAISDDMVEQLRAMDPAMWSRMNPGMIGWVESLHQAGITTALLSNMQHDMAAYARKNFSWLKFVDHHIFSCELRLIKPDVAIFQHTIERIGVPAHETLFVDDREPNVEAARKIGVRGIRFEGVDALAKELQAMDFRILPQGDGCQAV